jgi:uncharacterized RDD family membrane protein YckC
MELEIQSQPPIVAANYASTGRRFVALLIDGIILGILGLITSFIVPVIGGIIIWFLYAPMLESSELRATLGKHLMGIQVADLMGRRISMKAAIVRNLMKIVSGAFMFIGFIFAFFTGRKQSLHDLLADTIVVYGRSEAPVVDTWIETTKDAFNVGNSNMTSYSETNDSVVIQLERLERLRSQGTITEAEFEAAKKKVLV